VAIIIQHVVKITERKEKLSGGQLPVASSSVTVGDVETEISPAALWADKPLLHRPKTLTGSRILIVEDDIHLGRFLSRELKLSLSSVDVRHDGAAAYEELQKSSYDLVILGLNLPKTDGMAFLKQVRVSQPRLSILVLTARNHTEDLIQAFEHGADDCLIKPFSFLELLARVRSLLRRNSIPATRSSKVGDLTVNWEEHRVARGERRIDLTPREFAILEYMMGNVGKPVSRMTLMREVWNVPYDPTTNIVDVYMKYLRDKIDLDGEVKLIRTVRSVGYVLSND
jgi:two-component system copper resistance phosphate regulon response regulator CusR